MNQFTGDELMGSLVAFGMHIDHRVVFVQEKRQFITDLWDFMTMSARDIRIERERGTVRRLHRQQSGFFCGHHSRGFLMPLGRTLGLGCGVNSRYKHQD
ncbi:MAG: hypothetical protein C4293_16390 [Nitrospiraceae bacterium]